MTFEEWKANYKPRSVKLIDAAKDAWDAATEQAVPEGYVVVPVEPTLEMIRAANRMEEFECPHTYEPEDVYKAMIQAAQEGE